MARRVRQATPEPLAARFQRLARERRAQDLRRLVLLGAIVSANAALIHALQKERGASSIFLGSGGKSFAAQRAERSVDSERQAQEVRDGLAHLGAQPDATAGARFYLKAARVLRQLDVLAPLRTQIQAQTLTVEESLQGFSQVIADLLAMSFEAADLAADPAISRAMVALASFSQGKEYAGQERATAGGAFSQGRIDASSRTRLQHLATAQAHALRIFREFAAPELVALLDIQTQAEDWKQVERIREIAQKEEIPSITADEWYEVATRRIDALKVLEDAMTTGLTQLCEQALEQTPEEAEPAGLPLALLITDADPKVSGLEVTGVGCYLFESPLPRPLRSVLDVLDAQSRRISDVSSQLEAAQAALSERKIIEKAKGLLMKGHQLPESRAYALMREMAMSQNKRIIEVAETLIARVEGPKT